MQMANIITFLSEASVMSLFNLKFQVVRICEKLFCNVPFEIEVSQEMKIEKRNFQIMKLTTRSY